jgi:hypothetical protein
MVGFFINIFMEQNKKPVDKFFYSEKEWDRLGCGPLPEKRDRNNIIDSHAKGNPKIDNNVVKGYN